MRTAFMNIKKSATTDGIKFDVRFLFDDIFSGSIVMG